MGNTRSSLVLSELFKYYLKIELERDTMCSYELFAEVGLDVFLMMTLEYYIQISYCNLILFEGKLPSEKRLGKKLYLWLVDLLLVLTQMFWGITILTNLQPKRNLLKKNRMGLFLKSKRSSCTNLQTTLRRGRN